VGSAAFDWTEIGERKWTKRRCRQQHCPPTYV